MGRGNFSRRKTTKRQPSQRYKNNQSMISIWDSGIEYAQYKYDTGN